ncbi:MAG: NAD(+)/NADH kinase [Candidatus Omnitrophota bacterium]|nr:NAD(+)/NADH kinase [Candidatus Omnitrophota bacterium]
MTLRPRYRATASGRGPVGFAAAGRWAGCRPTRGVIVGATGSARGAPRVLVVYKKSAYHIYVLERRSPLFVGPKARTLPWDVRRLRQAHEAHQATLTEVERALRARGLRYRVIYRAMQHDYSPYDLVISVGGDGTFLEAARGVTRQPILGVNSDPARSAGTFCRADARTFAGILEAVLNGGARTLRLHRMRLTLNGEALGFQVLNDILVAHQNPAAMSRYEIQVNGVKEEQRSSGLWLSTAVGSTAAIKSAGGQVLPRDSKAIQYLPRELYYGSGATYRLTGGLVPPGRTITLRSLMREGMVYVDGEHLKIPFRYGDVLRVSRSPQPLSVVDG